ncbi:hypothetical protein FB384_005267 [Prauserella sediminis]|uniref:Uncharacterized protein n=1 Tax=Prauserella sediminis TaxID=577680 RepID=A0A839Y1U7_9PSEU|nr:hypothetical protein [Prauserella sediminis]MBB3666306.1 hypothetical protein [Prauserella sediminis]
MTEPGSANVADSGSNVGLQVGHIENSNVQLDVSIYESPAEPSPRERYECGVAYLKAGAPQTALSHIDDAIRLGYTNSEAHFYRMLAVLSKRSLRDLSAGDRSRVDHARSVLSSDDADKWMRGLHVIIGMLDCLKQSGSNSSLILQEYGDLAEDVRALIREHLALVAEGPVKQALWAETLDAAYEAQQGNHRTNRAWIYFQPVPVGARARRPAPIATTSRDWLRATILTVVMAVGVGWVGWQLLTAGAGWSVVALIVALAGGLIATRTGLDWRYRHERGNAMESAYQAGARVNVVPVGGFAEKVTSTFEHYFRKFAPTGCDPQAWSGEMSGIRSMLRNEVVDIYREERISPGRVNWLIRYLIKDVSARYQDGTLYERVERYRVPEPVKTACVLSAIVLLVSLVPVLLTAIQANPITAVAVVVVVAVSGRYAVPVWFWIVFERWRYAEDVAEYEDNLAARKQEYERWSAFLRDNRPREPEMEAWLNADKNIILERALRLYKLTWNDIVAYTFLSTPNRPCQRAQAKGGPARYSKYEIQLFLITWDGVREFTIELDFIKAAIHGEERKNYRFAAISSIRVTKTGAFSYVLDLTLTNGPTRTTYITDPDASPEVETSTPKGPPANGSTATASDFAPEFTNIDLDVAGFTHTLHVLEGIAAEGRNWLNRGMDENTTA